MKDINDLRRVRTTAATLMETTAALIATLEDAEDATEEATTVAIADFDAAKASFDKADAAVKRVEAVEAAAATQAQTDDTNNTNGVVPTGLAPATARNEADFGIETGFMIQALAACGGDRDRAVQFLDDGGNTGISAALSGATQGAGGVTIPQAQAADVIEMLRPRVAVRASGARQIDMPAGEIRHARQNGGATANYVGENVKIPESEPTFDKVDQSFKKLTGLVPIGNSLLRHSSTGLARLVRDDVIKIMALREDLAFIRGDGTANTPTGIKNWILPANWQTAVAIAPAVVEIAIRGLVSKVEDSDVGMIKPGWIMRASAKNFLASLREPNSGAKLFPSIESKGELMGYPIKTTSQIPVNLGIGANETEIYFGDFDEVFIGDAMVLTFATSTEATFIDAGGTTRSAFQDDLTLMRAISEHDLAPRHDEALAGLTGAGWTL